MAEDNSKAKEEQIVEWIRLVDKPLGTKEEKKQSVDQIGMEQTEK